MMRAICPFFEVIAFSCMPQDHLDLVIDHIENVLNKPIIDMYWLSTENADKNKSALQQIQSKKRRVKIVEPKIYFQFLFGERNYLYLPQAQEKLENFHLLTSNRKPENIFLLSSNPLRVVAAMAEGFCALPIIKY